MKNLVKDARPGDKFLFHCKRSVKPLHILLFIPLLCFLQVSGHGSQVVNHDGTEKDGFDEGNPLHYLISNLTNIFHIQSFFHVMSRSTRMIRTGRTVTTV